MMPCFHLSRFFLIIIITVIMHLNFVFSYVQYIFIIKHSFSFLAYMFLWMGDLKQQSLGSAIQMFCPSVGVIQCCDVEDATETQERDFFLHPHHTSSSHSSPHPLSPAFCQYLKLASLKNPLPHQLTLF